MLDHRPRRWPNIKTALRHGLGLTGFSCYDDHAVICVLQASLDTPCFQKLRVEPIWGVALQ